jgi:hypothetical protein
LDLFPPDFSQICQVFVNLVYFFKEPSFRFVPCMISVVSISLINKSPYFLLFLCFCMI